MMEGKKPTESKRRCRLQYLQGLEANPNPGQMSGIDHPGMNDVMFGRGGDTNYHIGNNSFRHLVESYQEKYWAASNRKEKSQIIAAIVNGWRTQDPPGRFLAKTNPEMGEESLWHDVGDQVAGRKASKILSEMRIGRKKNKAAAAKRKGKGRESPQQSDSESETKQQSEPDVAETETNTKEADSPESSASPRIIRAEDLPGMPRRFSEPLRALSYITSLRESPPTPPASSYSGVGAPLSQQQPEQDLGAPTTSFLRPPEDMCMLSTWGFLDSLPTAASLTEVFQEQFITSELAECHLPSPTTRVGIRTGPGQIAVEQQVRYVY